MYVILVKLFTWRGRFEWCYVNTFQNAKQARAEAARLKKKHDQTPLKIITYHEWKKATQEKE